MNSQVIKIELITSIGTFKFEKHHCSEADFYQAMLNFESNNWEMLGETSYKVYEQYEDGDIQTITHEGINASCNLSAHFDEDYANELNAMYQAQY